MFWIKESAEGMIQIRAQIVTGRWDARLQDMRRFLACDGRLDCCCVPRRMSIKVAGNEKKRISPKEPKFRVRQIGMHLTGLGLWAENINH